MQFYKWAGDQERENCKQHILLSVCVGEGREARERSILDHQDQALERGPGGGGMSSTAH